MLRLLPILTAALFALQHHASAVRQCEPVVSSMCADLYNSTKYPNLLGLKNQERALLALHQYTPLVKVKCSRYLKLFLCSVYVPECSDVLPEIPPCRSLCNAARNGCVELMNRFGFKWPEALKCNRFPARGDGSPCIDGGTVAPGSYAYACNIGRGAH